MVFGIAQLASPPETSNSCNELVISVLEMENPGWKYVYK
jgi:hypothetical protein